MLEGHHLTHGREPDDRGAFPTAVVTFDQVKATRRQNEEAAVYRPAIAARLLDEGRDGCALALERPVPARWAHRRNRCELPVVEMEVDRRADIHITHSVAVGEAEGRLGPEVTPNA